jgi:hypothetical protein
LSAGTTGKITEFVIFLFGAIMVLIYLRGGLQGRKYELRHMRQVDAIEEGVERAVEQGKPVYACAGFGALEGMFAPMTISAMNVLRYTARLAVRKNAKITFEIANAEHTALVDGIYREVCVSEGKPEAYNRENVKYRNDTSWWVAAIGDMLRDGVSCWVELGATGGSMPEGAWAHVLGGLTIGGTQRYTHQGTWAAYAHYPLFCEDVYAAGAICTDDEVVKSSLVGGDIVKLVTIGLVIVITLLAVTGVPILSWITH